MKYTKIKICPCPQKACDLTTISACAKTCSFANVCVYKTELSVGCYAEVTNNLNIFVAYNKRLFLTQFVFYIAYKNQFLLCTMLSSFQDLG